MRPRSINPLLAGTALISCPSRASAQRFGLLVATALSMAAGAWLFVLANESPDPLTMNFGGWDAPVGIDFADLLSATMVAVAGLIGFCGAWYALGDVPARMWRKNYAFFYLLLLTGINGAFLTGDLFNLFVWFEVMLMASFAMMVLGRGPHTAGGTLKYVILNLVASFFFLTGVGLLYGGAGTLNLAQLGVRLAGAGTGDGMPVATVLLLLAFGIKAGVFPVYFWLPASYPHTAFATSAVFGGLLTKVGVYALFRVFGGGLGFLSETTGPLLLWVGMATMVAGVLGAASRYHLRSILSFHIISQIGYLVIGIGLFTQGAFAAAIFYTVHHIVVKTNLFFVAGLIASTGRSEKLGRLGGLFGGSPMLAALFAIPALSLSGIPPLSGFFAKFLVIREAFRAGEWWVAALALGVGVLTLFSMSKIWAEVFWKKSPRASGPRAPVPGDVRLGPVILLSAVTVAIGMTCGSLHEISVRAAGQIVRQNALATEAREGYQIEAKVTPP